MVLNYVASERHDMEVERIGTVACEAYTLTSSIVYLIIEIYLCLAKDLMVTPVMHLSILDVLLKLRLFLITR